MNGILLVLLFAMLLVQGCVCGAPEPAPRATRRAHATSPAAEAAEPVAKLRQQVEKMKQETLRRARVAADKQDKIRTQLAILQVELAAVGDAEQRRKLHAQVEKLRRTAKEIRTSRDTSRRRELDRVEQLRLRRTRSGR